MQNIVKISQISPKIAKYRRKDAKYRRKMQHIAEKCKISPKLGTHHNIDPMSAIRNTKNCFSARAFRVFSAFRAFPRVFRSRKKTTKIV
jgi:hypothetical protein